MTNEQRPSRQLEIAGIVCVVLGILVVIFDGGAVLRVLGGILIAIGAGALILKARELSDSEIAMVAAGVSDRGEADISSVLASLEETAGTAPGDPVCLPNQVEQDEEYFTGLIDGFSALSGTKSSDCRTGSTRRSVGSTLRSRARPTDQRRPWYGRRASAGIWPKLPD